jgi:hypothetical protein
VLEAGGQVSAFVVVDVVVRCGAELVCKQLLSIPSKIL